MTGAAFLVSWTGGRASSLGEACLTGMASADEGWGRGRGGRGYSVIMVRSRLSSSGSNRTAMDRPRNIFMWRRSTARRAAAELRKVT